MTIADEINLLVRAIKLLDYYSNDIATSEENIKVTSEVAEELRDLLNEKWEATDKEIS